jgi:hypothetical protein
MSEHQEPLLLALNAGLCGLRFKLWLQTFLTVKIKSIRHGETAVSINVFRVSGIPALMSFTRAVMVCMVIHS